MKNGFVDISINGAQVAFRTPFSPFFDLIQIFQGLDEGPLFQNNPVDFLAAGLQRKGHPDIWHMDQVLAFSTDEASPVVINGEDIGCNHSHPCGVEMLAPCHGKDCTDIGSLWQDQTGLTWTLMRVLDGDRLLFLSENIGSSPEDYAFASAAVPPLTYISDGRHQEPIRPVSQQGGVQLHRSIRHRLRQVFYYKDGHRLPLTGSREGCDQAEICEEFEIINPATVAETLRKSRPIGGYSAPQDLAVGEPMFLYRMTYRILGDGTILCDFDHRLLQDVRLLCYLGIMYQEKCDISNRGIWRCIPKAAPFDHEGISYDFSVPYNTSASPLPYRFPLTREHWALPDNPPDRQIDFIRGPGGPAFTEGPCVAAFAGGFLPCFDGRPEHRRHHITDAVDLAGSRKTYPIFAGGAMNILRETDPACADGREPLLFRSLRGVAYKKYFLPSEKSCSQYPVNYEGDTYLYMDFFGDETVSQSFSLPDEVRVAPLELAPSLTWTLSSTDLTVSGKKGYAVFRISPV